MSMDHRSVFDKAMSWKLSEYTFSGNEVLRNIMERANKMEKRKETRRRVLGIAGGVAGAAAVIAGAVFGLNWLNEHGGLKGPDVRGAGYNEGLIEPSGPNDALAADEESAGTKDILLAAGDVLEFTDMTAEIKNVEYDGQFLVAAVSTEYYGGNYPSDTEYVSLGLLPVSKPGYVGAAVIDERDMLTDRAFPDPDNENKRLHKVACYVKPEPGQSADFTVAYYPPDLDGKSEKLGNYTLTGRDMSGETFTAEDANAGISVTVSAFGAVIESPHDYSEDERFDLTLRFGDGSELVLADRDTTLGETLWSPDRLYDEYHEYFSGLGCGRTCVMSVKAEPIDVKNVACVLINGEEIGASSDTSGSKDILQSVGDVLEFENLTATINRVDFDGTFLRVYYTPSNYEESFSDPQTFINIHSSADPDEGDGKLICGGVRYDEDTHSMCAYSYIDLEEGETFDLSFKLFSGESSKQYTLTGTANSYNTITVYDIADNKWIRLSPMGVVTAGSENYLRNPKCSVEIKYNDGSIRNLYPAGWASGAQGEKIEKLFELESGDFITAFGSVSTEPIDVKNVACVLINGEEIGASSDTSGSKDILQSVGDVLEFSDMTAKISKYDYDGQFLRVMVEATYQYPLSETEGFDRLNLNVKNIGNYDVGEFCLNDYQYVTAPYYHEIAEMIWNDPNADNWDEAADMDRFGRTVMYDMGIYIRLDPGQTAELQFGHLPAQGSVREYAGNYTLTGLTGIETAEAFYTVTDKETDTTVNVSRYGAFVEGANDFGKDDSFSLAVKYKDGTQKLLADRPVKKETYPTDDIPYYRFASYYTELGRGRAYMMSSVFMDGKIDVANISAVAINGREISDTDSEGDTTAEYYDPTAERNTYISIDYSHANVSSRYEFLYYIDGELQKDMTETRELSDTDKFRWDVAGSGVHRYKVLLRNPETRYYEILFDVSINFTKREPEKTFIGEFDPKIFKNVAEKEVGDLSLIAGIYAPGEEPYEVVESEETSGNTSNVTPPEFPIAVSNGNGFYGEFLDPPITGDEAWELVKQRGGIDFDYNLPYDKSLFTFTGAAFVIDYADCDVKAIVGGTVEYAGWYPGWGQTVLLQDENGHYWLYGHLGEISAAEGDKVERGAKLGHTGTTGNTTNQLYALRVG